MEKSVILNAADLKDDVVETTTEKILANPEKFYLLSASSNMKLCNVIDSLSKTLKDKAALTCVRFAYDIYFELETEVRTGDNATGFKVQSFADLLDNLDYDENLNLKREDYHIVINDDGVETEKADKAAAELFQQTAFLNLNIDIQKKSEIKKSLLKKNIREKYFEIEENRKFFAEIFSNSNKIVESFDSILEELNKIKLRPIRVAVFGSKKAGKSILTECLSKSKDLEVQEISFGKYFYFDFTYENRKIIEESIDAADVCIFVMNYSNHLTIDEVKFLNQIREVLESNNKLNSLIFVVNRIDEYYAVAEEKSVNRILDYISGKLKELGQKDNVIFGTSALQSFYLDKVLTILKNLNMEVDEDDSFYDVVRQLGRKYPEYKTQIFFIKDALMNLEDFHNIEEPDAKTLEIFSDIPQLLKYITYIGNAKADMEIF